MTNKQSLTLSFVEPYALIPLRFRNKGDDQEKNSADLLMATDCDEPLFILPACQVEQKEQIAGILQLRKRVVKEPDDPALNNAKIDYKTPVYAKLILQRDDDLNGKKKFHAYYGSVTFDRKTRKVSENAGGDVSKSIPFIRMTCRFYTNSCEEIAITLYHSPNSQMKPFLGGCMRRFLLTNDSLVGRVYVAMNCNGSNGHAQPESAQSAIGRFIKEYKKEKIISNWFPFLDKHWWSRKFTSFGTTNVEKKAN